MTKQAPRSTKRSNLGSPFSDTDPCAIPLAGFVTNSTSAMVMTDRDLRILAHSDPWAKLLGLEGQMIGRTLYDLYPKISAHYKMVYDWTLAGNTGRGDRVHMRRVGGGKFWCDAELSAWRTLAGEVGGLINSLFPVTETLAAEDRQLRSQRRLELAVGLASLHVWEMDFTHGTVETNGSDADIFDRAYTYEELISEPYISCHPDDRDRLKAHVKADITAGSSSAMEYRVNRVDGKTVWVSAITELVFENGQATRLVGVMQNITDRKLAEIEMAEARDAANAASLAKSTFLATVSHEIRTPMNGVLGMVQAMAAEDLHPSQRERLEIIRQSGQSLLAVLNDVLDLSKIEAGKLTLDPREFDLSVLAKGAHAAFTAVANEKGLSFNLTIAEAARGRYLGDSVRIRQILYNLISNAMKFTDEGCIHVKIGRRGDALTIVVHDTGVGIPQEVQGRLFQRFMQADASTTRRHGGTGLGLAITRELAQLMGGRITVQSRPGEGSLFRVSLPLARLGAERAQREVQIVAPLAPARAERPVRILAAEDNLINQLVLKTLLAQIGVDLTVVEDGQAAVEAWAGADWDVVLMDVQMPRLDGPSAAREIRRRETAEGRARTPIIAVTANAMAHQREEYRASDMDAVVGKPLNIGELLATIEKLRDQGADSAKAAA